MLNNEDMASAASGDAAKEIKAQLKQARELFNQKDHNGALKISEVCSQIFIFKSFVISFDRLL